VASKIRHKQYKALKRRLRKKANAIPALDGLGEYFQEFLLRSVYIYSLRHGQESIPEVTSRIKSLFEAKRFDKLALLLNVDKMPLEKAQILAYRAMATRDVSQARELALRALEQDPSNIDAQIWLARHDFTTSKHNPAEILGRMQAIVDLGERMLGPEVGNMQGRVHEIPVARPYLRALDALFTSLIACRNHSGALRVGHKLLSLCPPEMFDIKNRMEALKPKVGLSQPANEPIRECPSDQAESVPSDAHPQLSPDRAQVLQEISDLLKGFCDQRLDRDFMALTLKAASMLCQNASCPVHRGKRESWASGIVNALAQANAILGSSATESIQPVDIHTSFKVSSSTTSKKSSQIKKILGIGADNPHWLLKKEISSGSF
jgi:hypothetical protein